MGEGKHRGKSKEPGYEEERKEMERARAAKIR